MKPSNNDLVFICRYPRKAIDGRVAGFGTAARSKDRTEAGYNG